MDTRSRRIGLLILALVLVGLALLVTSRTGPSAVIPGASASASATPGDSGDEAPSGTSAGAILLAVGDVAYCGASADEQVGHLAARLSGTIALL